MHNLSGEINHEISKQTSVNKKSLTLSVFKKVIENKKAKQELVALFEKREISPNEDIKEFLDKIAPLIQDTLNKDEPPADNEENTFSAEMPVRTYVIAHIFIWS